MQDNEKQPLLTEEQQEAARNWYFRQGIDLQTIGQHFGLSYEQIAAEFRKMGSNV